MPRRPRPATRRPAAKSDKVSGEHKSAVHRDLDSGALRTSRNVRLLSKSSSRSQSDEDEDEEDSADPSVHEEPDYEENSDADPDQTRVSQWVDDEELEALSHEESEVDEHEAEVEKESALDVGQRNDLASLPFGALRRAQQALARATVAESSDEESQGDAELEEASSDDRLEGSSKETQETFKPKRQIPKRSNKHAPTEITSKKPVPRKRLPEGEKRVARDPRFLELSGEFSSQKFQSQYGFLASMHQQELKTLKENLRRARKMLLSSPRDLREEREQEVQRLERALKRAESMVNKDRRERIEQEALHKVSKEEREKRKEGKGAWYMKDSDKKALLLRAKFEALAAEGGKGAVRKAIEKKQKKVGQKEKKRRPEPSRRDGSGSLGNGGKRLRVGSAPTGGAPHKRRRME